MAACSARELDEDLVVEVLVRRRVGVDEARHVDGRAVVTGRALEREGERRGGDVGVRARRGADDVLVVRLDVQERARVVRELVRALDDGPAGRVHGGLALRHAVLGVLEGHRVDLALLVALGGDRGPVLRALDRGADAEALRLQRGRVRRVGVDVDEDLAVLLDPLVLGEVVTVCNELIDVRLAVDVDLNQRRIRAGEVVVGVRQTSSRKQQRSSGKRRQRSSPDHIGQNPPSRTQNNETPRFAQGPCLPQELIMDGASANVTRTNGQFQRHRSTRWRVGGPARPGKPSYGATTGSSSRA